MYTLRGTKKFLQRYGAPVGDRAVEPSTTAMGDWYVNVLFWKPHVAIFVNAITFLPILTPMTPVRTVAARFPAAMAEVLEALDVDHSFVERELAEMFDVAVTTTASRRVLGVMNEFVFMAEHAIATGRNDPADLVGLSVWLADTIVGPLTERDGYTPVGALKRVVIASAPPPTTDHRPRSSS